MRSFIVKVTARTRMKRKVAHLRAQQISYGCLTPLLHFDMQQYWKSWRAEYLSQVLFISTWGTLLTFYMNVKYPQSNKRLHHTCELYKWMLTTLTSRRFKRSGVPAWFVFYSSLFTEPQLNKARTQCMQAKQVWEVTRMQCGQAGSGRYSGHANDLSQTRVSISSLSVGFSCCLVTRHVSDEQGRQCNLVKDMQKIRSAGRCLLQEIFVSNIHNYLKC